MGETIRCSVCGASNPDSLERCRACNQLLRQSTTELNGFGDRIASGQTPTEKKTSELERALPAWLRRARNTDQDETEKTPEEAPVTENSLPSEPEADEEPIFPDFSAEDDEDDDNDVDPADWLAGLEDSADDDEEEEAADWLVNLQSDLAPDEPDEEEVSSTDGLISANAPPVAGDETALAEEDGLPDWISSLQGDASASADDLPDLVPTDGIGDSLPGEDGVPDWLSRMSEEADAASETPVSEPASAPQVDAAPVESDAGDLPDWMADLQSVGEISTEGFPILEEGTVQETPVAEQIEEPAIEEDLPDWMANLQGAEEISAAEEPVVSVPSSDDLPEWLSDGEEPADEVAPAEASDEMPDWISNLQVEEESAVLGASDDLPDWLSGGESAGEAASAEEAGSDLPDWMTGSTSEEAPAAEAAADDLPDWISSGETTTDAIPAEAVEDLPDWMSNLQADEEISPKALDVEETPEWLSGGEIEAAVSSALASDASAELASDLPDWMDGLKEAEPVANIPQQEDVPVAETSSQEGGALSEDVDLPIEEGDVPEWLSRVGQPVIDSVQDVDDGSSELEAVDEAPGWLDSIPGIDDLDSEEPVESELLEETSAAPSPSPAFVEEGIAESGDDEIFGIDMPDWLSSLAPEDLAVGEKQDAEDAVASQEAELSGAELPSWVQAMRPVASVVSDASSGKDSEPQSVAESGPLAGLSGILPVGVGIGPKSKPQAHSLKLRVNESQQSGAMLLERILESEAEAAPLQGEDAPVSIPLLRWIIAALMIVVVGAGLLSPQELAPSPNIAVPEIGAAVNIINQLPAEGTALVIFDYEAALSAELQAAAAPLVDHLMLRGQKLAFLSSTPNGPALAERFLNETQSRHQYQLGDSYINLGYLPGGASGMLSFVASPRAAIAGQLNGIPFWDHAPLANISQITDFSAVIILTDDVEKGRAWIEQASVTLNAASTPLLMAVSAQVEPIVYPYYASAQVDGLVSGLNGGATYERLQGQSGLGREYWDAYSVGLLAAEILIVLGAVLNFMAGVRTRQNVNKEEE